MSSKKKQPPLPLKGIRFCITGALTKGTRDNYKTFIESQGGTYTNSVGPSTNYLVTNFPTSNTDKNQNAKRYNVPVINEGDLHRMIVELQKIEIWKNIINQK
jgi:DNA ligase (NAD+)